MSLENSGEVLARSYRGECGWLLVGSYKHGVAVSTPEDYGEEVKRKTTVWKIIIYRVEEGLGAKEKGKRSMTPWNLQEGNYGPTAAQWVSALSVHWNHLGACESIAPSMSLIQ